MLFHTSLVFVLFHALVFARPQEPVENFIDPQQNVQRPNAASQNSGSTPIPIISQTETIGENGSYSYSFETGNGIKKEETAYLKHVTGLRARGNFAADDPTPDEEDILVQTGSFSYTAPDGTVITLKYIADENGFQPTGDHLPSIPPIAGAAQRTVPSERTQVAGQGANAPLPVPAAPVQPVSSQPAPVSPAAPIPAAPDTTIPAQENNSLPEAPQDTTPLV